MQFPFDNSYASLPERFYSRTRPTPVRAPRLIRLNTDLATELNLDVGSLSGETGAQIFSGNVVPPGAEPIATAYAGHQFGGFVPQLGDGRAILLGEVIDRSGTRRDIQLKGSGRTPFSRGGDGRAAIGPVLREYILSEAMHVLGIPTTRSLAAVVTGEDVYRETALPGALLTRVAASHIRVGTFQFFASRRDTEAVRILADYVIARHYPDTRDAEQPYRALLENVATAQAKLLSQWMLVGFIHGVMNTDNMSIAGETIDYGPCAFMDEYNPAMVFSSIDIHGRYSYMNQPAIAQWNLVRLAECLLPLLSENADAAVAHANDALSVYPGAFEAAYDSGLRAKLGLSRRRDEDPGLMSDLLTLMTDNGADFTLTFRHLAGAAGGSTDDALRNLFIDQAALDAWLARWRARIAHEPGGPEAVAADMRRVNPAFIPRNHRVEAVIRAATDDNDFAPFEEMLHVLSRPFDDQPEYARYMSPPAEHERVRQTFCGT